MGTDAKHFPTAFSRARSERKTSAAHTDLRKKEYIFSEVLDSSLKKQNKKCATMCIHSSQVTLNNI